MPNIEISDQEHDDLKRHSDKEGMKIKALVAKIIREWFDRNGRVIVPPKKRRL